MESLSVFALFAAAALAGWALAEGKARIFTYTNSKEEDDEEKRQSLLLRENGYHEASIRDIIKNTSFRGYSA